MILLIFSLYCSVKVSIWGRVGTVDEFREILEESARDIKAIVEM